jgi:aldehyde reductase
MPVPLLKLNSGHQMPQFGLGTWLSEPGEVGQAVKIALEIGYRHFDCAILYENQKEIGEIFKVAFKDGKVKREDVFITSKMWNNQHSYAKATSAIDTTLKELEISYLDLFLIHFPMSYFEDGGMVPMDENGKMKYSNIDYLETWKALEDAVKAGKVKSIGLSNFNSKQIQRVIDNSKIKPAVLQVESNPYFSQTALLEWCKKQRIVFTAYSPLANNAHAFRKEGQTNLLEEKVMKDIAGKYNKSPAQVALRWGIERGTAMIPKSIKRNRLEENMNIWDFKLTADDMKAIDGLNKNLRLLGLEQDSAHPDYPFHDTM